VINKTIAGDKITEDDLENLTFVVTGPDGYEKTVKLGEFTDNGDGTYTYVIEDLDEGEYTVEETQPNIPGYNVKVTTSVNHGDETEGQKAGGSVGEGETLYVDITDDYTLITTEVSAVKVWDDLDDVSGKRPESLNVVLYADGAEIGTYALNAENGWTVKVEGLRKFSESDGTTEIAYTWSEANVPEGYVQVSAETVEGVTTFTNKYREETVDVPVTKVWRGDYEDQYGTRPASITVNLIQYTAENPNGTVIQSVELTAAMGWKYVFTDLPKTVDGKEALYTVTENAVEYYYSSVALGEDGVILLYNDIDENHPKLPNKPKTPEGGTPKTPNKPKVPDTSDNMNTGFWGGMLGVSLLGVLYALISLKKRRYE